MDWAGLKIYQWNRAGLGSEHDRLDFKITACAILRVYNYNILGLTISNKSPECSFGKSEQIIATVQNSRPSVTTNWSG
jgi:hypothetical protein